MLRPPQRAPCSSLFPAPLLILTGYLFGKLLRAEDFLLQSHRFLVPFVDPQNLGNAFKRRCVFFLLIRIVHVLQELRDLLAVIYRPGTFRRGSLRRRGRLRVAPLPFPPRYLFLKLTQLLAQFEYLLVGHNEVELGQQISRLLCFLPIDGNEKLLFQDQRPLLFFG